MIPPISPEERERALQVGLTPTNPTQPKFPTAVITPHGAEEGFTPFDQKTQQAQMHLASQIQKGTQPFEMPIWRSMQSRFFHTQPQDAIESAMRAFQHPGSHIFYDIETLGALESDVFTPTEMAFGRYDQFGQPVGLPRTFLIRPDEKVAGRLESWIHQAQTGQTLTATQQRTLADLMKYSEGVQFEHGAFGTAITKHSALPDQIRAQAGENILFHQAYTVGGRRVDPAQKAREGLEFLKRYGMDPGREAAPAVKSFLERNIDQTFVGYNVKAFDEPAIHKFLQQQGLGPVNIKHQVDMYETLQSIYKSPAEMARDLDADDLSRYQSGLMQLGTVAGMAGVEPEHPHAALYDVQTTANVFQRMKPVITDRIREMRQAAAPLDAATTDYYFDDTPLGVGDKLFAQEAAWAPPGDFKNFVMSPEGDLLDHRTYLTSKIGYTVDDLYETEFEGKKLYGAAFRDDLMGDVHYVHREDPAELKSFIQQKFQPVTEKDVLGKINAASASKLQEFPGIGPTLAGRLVDYKKQHGIFQSAQELQRVQGVGQKRADGMLHHAFEEQLGQWREQKLADFGRRRYRKLFSAEPGGTFWSTRKMFEALDIERAYRAGDITEAERMERLRGHFYAFGETKEKMVRDFDVIKDRLMAEEKLFRPAIEEIEQRDLGSMQKSVALAEFHERVTGLAGYEPPQDVVSPVGTDRFGLHLPGTAGEERFIPLRSPDAATKNINRILQHAREREGGNIARSKLQLQRMIDHVAPQFDATERQRLEEIKGALHQQQTTGGPAQMFASFLHAHKDKFAAGGIGTTAVGEWDVPYKFGDSPIDRLFEESVAHAKGMQAMTPGALFGDEFQQKLPRGVDVLQEQMQRAYDVAGITKPPETMHETLQKTMQAMHRRFQEEGVDVGMSIYDTGTVEEPKLTMALFDAKRAKSVLGKDLDSLSGAARIDVPLVSPGGYMTHGRQTKIAPLAFIERYRDNVKVHSGFSKALERLTFQNTLDDMAEAVRTGDFARVEQIAHKRIREGMQGLSGAHDFYDAEHFDLDPRSPLYDTMKRFQIDTSGYYGDKFTGEWTDEAGDPMRIYDESRMRALREELPGVIRRELGVEDLAVASARGENLLEGKYPLMDVRDFAPLGYFDDAGRPNIIQMWNMRPLEPESVGRLRELPYATTSPLFAPKQFTDFFGMEKIDQALREGKTETALQALGKMPALNVTAKIMDEAELMDTLAGYYDDPSAAAMPSLYEDQGIIRESMARAMESVKQKPAYTVEGMYSPELKEDIVRAVQERGEYRLDYMEDFIKKTTVEGEAAWEKFDKATDHFITGYRYTDEGALQVDLEERFQVHKGTKFMFGTEKFTVSEILPDEIFDKHFGPDTSLLIDPSYGSHAAYGDVLSGYVKQAMMQANSMQIAKQQEAVRQIADVVRETFGFDVHAVRGAEGYRLDYMYDEITPGMMRLHRSELDEMLGKLRGIEGISIDETKLTSQLVMSAVDESYHFKSVSGFGKHGARIGLHEAEMLRAAGFEESGRYIEQSVLDRADPERMREARGAFRGLEYLYKYDNRVPGLAEADIRRVDDFREMPAGALAGYRKKGLPAPEDLKGTILDPDRGETWLQLPEPVQIDAGRKKRTLDKVFMPDPKLTQLQTGELTKSELAHGQARVFEAARQYQGLFGHTGEAAMTAAEGKEKMRTAVEDYYGETLHHLTGARGDTYRQIFTGRLKGSAGGLLQITSPLAELDESALAKHGDVFGSVADKAKHFALEDPNVVHISPQKALDLLDLENMEKYRSMAREGTYETLAPEAKERVDMMHEMLQGEGQPGFAARDPVKHPYSIAPVKLKAHEAVPYDGTRISSSMARVFYGDADGDRIAYYLAHGKHLDPQKFEQEHMDMGRALKQERAGMFDELADDIRAGKMSLDRVLGDKDYIEMQMGGDLAKGAGPVGDIFQAKVTNPAWTGYTTNVAESFRRMGLDYLEDDRELYKFQEAIGKMIQAPISGKHGDVVGMEAMLGSLQKGDWDAVRALKEPGTGAQFFDDEQVNILSKVKQMADVQGRDTWGHLAHDMWLSRRLYRRGIDDTMQMVFDEDAPVNYQVRRFVDIVGTEQAQEATRAKLERQRASLEGLAKTVTDDPVGLSKARSDFQQASKHAAHASGMGALEGMREKVAGQNIGAMKLGGLFLGGMYAGQFLTGGDLPMDREERPGLQPRRGHEDIEPMIHVSPDMMAGMPQEPVGIRRPGAMSSQRRDYPSMRQNFAGGHQGYDLNIRSKTTVGRDPDELARIVSDAVSQTAPTPVNIQVDAKDNREEIDQDWIQDQIVSSIRD